ncbi:hypothetical protein BS50DRAFT_375947 [Corynespora cassiicola Philippines]|uniref:Uncharacterized protein n=1 Tax=Corynespora cassiicola Philippines TaxID=1448308 RepID=A0A2T2NN83_CORCC|nr:hypothetical protein BS50DRAFT_375947 [Corynespora cassiicola Philippines]
MSFVNQRGGNGGLRSLINWTRREAVEQSHSLIKKRRRRRRKRVVSGRHSLIEKGVSGKGEKTSKSRACHVGSIVVLISSFVVYWLPPYSRYLVGLEE